MGRKQVAMDSASLESFFKPHGVNIKHAPDGGAFKNLLGSSAIELILGTDPNRDIKFNVKRLKKPFGQFLDALYDRVGWFTRAENRLEIKRKSASMNRPIRQTYTRARVKVEHSLKLLLEAEAILVEEKKHFEWDDSQFRKCRKELQICQERIAYFESFLAFVIHPTLRTDYEKEVALKQKVPKEYPLGQGSQKLFFDVVLSLDKLIEDFMCDACLEIPKASIDAFILRFCAELGIQHTTEENLHKIRSRSRRK